MELKINSLIAYLEEMQGWIPTLMKKLDEKALLIAEA